jgi:hypothetical protein
MHYKTIKRNVYKCESPSICLTLFLSNGTPQEILVAKDVPLGEMIPGKLLILLLCERNCVKATLLPLYYLCKGTEIVPSMDLCYDIGGKPRLSSAVNRIQGKIQTIFCCY